ncbi:uncharacterized protein LOC134816249 isoform X1 [Bolinopsis microptera]|uniref:uncharacterized protein LOC134816249 isoform X1 n=1 Tax=Bolinopsis microptera TaxID=2820187 RepID=UPI00307A3168
MPILFTESPPYTSSIFTTTPGKDLYSCIEYCEHGGLCSLTGPGMTAVCTCAQRYRGQFCEEMVFWFEFFFQDNKLFPVTGTGFAALFCIGVSLVILTFSGVLFYRRYKRLKSKSQEKVHFQQNTNPIFDDVHPSSRQELLVYQVAQPPTSTSPPPKPCSPQGQGICYLVPTSPEPAPEAAWQDFHNPGYRQSYIDSGV